MPSPTDTPLIWTTKGNLPVGSLEYCPTWTEAPDEISFVEEYRLEGEVVKRNVHVYLKKGVFSQSELGKIS